MEVVITEPSEKPLLSSLYEWWSGLAYRNQWAEWSLYWMFVSGILLWDPINIPWLLERWVLVAHVLSSLVLFPLIVLPFWLSHRRLLAGAKKQWLKLTGQGLDVLLLACAVSGFLLLFVGNRGDSFGWWSYMTHLITTLVLVPLLMLHAAKWSVLKPVWSFFRRLSTRFIRPTSE